MKYLILSTVFATIGWVFASFQDDSLVQTQYGPIQGKVTSIGRAFTRIPYAAPPIDYLRFQNPRAPLTWTDVLDTTEDPPGCPQICILTTFACPDEVTEDCLYLNVFTPPVSDNNTDLSVMVFIHGGSYISGYGGGWLYNGTNLANINNIIVVTINYRLGILGFLYDTDNEIYGNFGYMDQKFAIEWVYNNIAQFGGNPNSITIFGESAGASSVSLHLIDQDNIQNGPKFVGAIMESNPIGLQLRTFDNWEGGRNDFYNHLGCSTRDCLMSASMLDIVAAQEETKLNKYSNGKREDIDMPWTPTIIPLSVNKSSLLINQPVISFQNGDFVSAKWNVNIINGVNNNESSIFVSENITKGDYDRTVDGGFRDSDDARAVKDYYSVYLDNGFSYSYTLALMETDSMFKCANHNVSVAMSKFANDESNIFMYHFDGGASFGPYLLPAAIKQCWDLPCHTTELPFVFRPNFGGLDYRGDADHQAAWTEPETAFSEGMQRYWGNFAKNGSPGSETINGKTTNWINYDEPNRSTIVFKVNNTMMIDNYDSLNCEFWNQLGYNWIIDE